jgi:hypothetical protein
MIRVPRAQSWISMIRMDDKTALAPELSWREGVPMGTFTVVYKLRYGKTVNGLKQEKSNGLGDGTQPKCRRRKIGRPGMAVCTTANGYSLVAPVRLDI